MKRIYLLENSYKLDDETFICKNMLVRESLIESILSDLFSFGSLVSSFALNAYFVHSRLLAAILTIMFLIMLNSTKKIRITKEEFLEKFEEMTK